MKPRRHALACTGSRLGRCDSYTADWRALAAREELNRVRLTVMAHPDLPDFGVLVEAAWPYLTTQRRAELLMLALTPRAITAMQEKYAP